MNTRHVKKIASLALVLLLAACNEHASIEVHIDSTGKQKARALVDSAGAGLEKVGEKAKELGHRAKERLDNLATDSIHLHQ